MKKKILLIEDEDKLRRILKLVLTDNGYQVKTAENGKQGIRCWTDWSPDLVVTDLKMHPMDGLDVLRFNRLNYPHIPLIILTAHGSIETAVNAMKTGAFDFLTKPIDHKQLLESVKFALNNTQNEIKSLNDLIGSSEFMNQVKKDILLFASTDSSVLIRGESGTGKEIAARAIHESSDRSTGPFVKVNCAAIPKDLIESELFGHKKGAFTGASQNRVGAFVLADKGTLFLDEIGDLPIELQPKLLHAVEEKTITPIGENSPVPVSVKILSATNLNLETMVKENKFRSDLYYRLNTVSLKMPSLREKKEDICELAIHFIHYYCNEFKKPSLQLADEARAILLDYAWPGNVRELKNIIERAVLTSESDVITMKSIPDIINSDPAAHTDLNDPQNTLDLAAQEQALLLAALEKCAWNQSNAAKELGITRSALRYRLQKYGFKR